MASCIQPRDGKQDVALAGIHWLQSGRVWEGGVVLKGQQDNMRCRGEIINVNNSIIMLGKFFGVKNQDSRWRCISSLPSVRCQGPCSHSEESVTKNLCLCLRPPMLMQWSALDSADPIPKDNPNQRGRVYVITFFTMTKQLVAPLLCERTPLVCSDPCSPNYTVMATCHCSNWGGHISLSRI